MTAAPCDSRCVLVGVVGWPADGPVNDLPHASTVVCADPQHQLAAVEWVRSRTDHGGVFAPFRNRSDA
jgi:exo-beta-1,3-glucanase (GH17 family)